jgi:uncharacterized phage-associated protein
MEDSFERVLKSALAYLVHAYPLVHPGRPLTRTKLMKLLYLADLEAVRSLQTSLTNARWQSYYYGPFAQEILQAADDLDGKTLVQRVGTQMSGQPYFRYEPLGDAPGTNGREQSVLDGVIAQYGGLALPQLLEHVYATAPYRAARKLGDPIDLRVI